MSKKSICFKIVTNTRKDRNGDTVHILLDVPYVASPVVYILYRDRIYLDRNVHYIRDVIQVHVQGVTLPDVPDP